MGYRHIENLYRPAVQVIFLFRECYALEKVHGTSAHISWTPEGVRLSSGGMKAETFAGLFLGLPLAERFTELGHERVTVYGEAYGGKEQGMSGTYGKQAAFIVFEVQIGETWLNVENAADVAQKLGLEFVPYARGPATLDWLNSQRDADSEVAVRRGMGPGKLREGVVIRPVAEFYASNGERVIAKHKRDEFRERASTSKEIDPAALKVYEDAQAAALEWVTEMRMRHVLDKIPQPHGLDKTGVVVKAMMEDVLREASGEVVDSPELRKAIGTRTSKMFREGFAQ